MDDQTIIRCIQNGEVAVFADLVQKYHRQLLAFIFRLVGDARLAEDIGQEVFLKVYQELPGFDLGRGVPFVAWLFIIARNQTISALRKRGRRSTSSTCPRRVSRPRKRSSTRRSWRPWLPAWPSCPSRFAPPSC